MIEQNSGGKNIRAYKKERKISFHAENQDIECIRHLHIILETRSQWNMISKF